MVVSASDADSTPAPRSVEQFERQYAERSGVAVDWLHEHGRFGALCDCGEDDCQGYQMVSGELVCLDCGHYWFKHDPTCPCSCTAQNVDSPHQHAFPLIEGETESETGWWYFSFTDPDRPEGERFVHALYVDGVDVEAAIARSWALGLNPGGEIAFVPVPEEHMPPESERLRPMSKEELIAAGGGPVL